VIPWRVRLWVRMGLGLRFRCGLSPGALPAWVVWRSPSGLSGVLEHGAAEVSAETLLREAGEGSRFWPLDAAGLASAKAVARHVARGETNRPTASVTRRGP